MNSARLINSFTFLTLTDTQGHVYARSLRVLRTNPFGEKQQKNTSLTVVEVADLAGAVPT